jgi:5'-nucleotidase
VINVNVPARPTGGYECTRLARKLFSTGVEPRLDPRGRPYYWIDGPIIADAEPGTDVHAIHEGRISVTPLTLDSTATSAAPALAGLFRD